MTEEKRKPGRPKKNPEATVEKKPEVASTNGPTYEELLNIIQQMNNEIQTLKAGSNAPQQQASGNEAMTEVLSKLVNRRADEEVVLVHNFENLGGLSTHLELTGLVIDFYYAGEQRLLNWQQFEECVSKYRRLFRERYLLLGQDHADLAAKYGIPCVEGGKKTLDHNTLLDLYKLPVNELEAYINSLNDEDKEIVFTFWVGKCYTKEPGFYDRQKVEMLNRISDNRMENLIAYMNGDYLREK